MRLHWVGPAVAGKGPRTPPEILVEFVPCKTNSRAAALLSDPRNYSWGEAFRKSVDVGYLPKLRIGSLWVRGIPEDYPNYESLTIDAQILHATGMLMAPRDRTRRGNSIIPRMQYPISPEIGKSAVFVVPTFGKTRALVFPCTEILRFYYAPSSKLAVALLDGTWITDRGRLANIRKSTFDTATLRGKIYLGKYADDDDLLEIARMLFGNVARKESESILPLASVHRAAGSKYPIIIRPPFEGNTRLTVRGMTYRTGGYPVFLVFEIVACTAPMPWSELKWNRDNPGKQGRSNTPVTDKVGYAGSYRKITSVEDGRSAAIASGPPSANDVPLRIDGGLNSSRYKTALNTSFEPRGPIEVTGASVYSAEALAGETFALGRVAFGSRYRAASLVASAARDVPSKLSAFLSAVSLLQSVDEDVTLLDYDVFDFAKPSMPDEPRGRLWAYVDHSLRQQPRRAAVARVRTVGVPFVLIDIESRARKSRSNKHKVGKVLDEEPFAIAVLRSPFNRAVSDDDLCRILRDLIEVGGIISRDAWELSPYSAWRHAKLKHIPGERADRYARRMIERMRGPKHF